MKKVALVLLILTLAVITGYGSAYAFDSPRHFCHHPFNIKTFTGLPSVFILPTNDLSGLYWQYLLTIKPGRNGWVYSDFALKSKYLGKPIVGKVTKGKPLN